MSTSSVNSNIINHGCRRSITLNEFEKVDLAYQVYKSVIELQDDLN